MTTWILKRISAVQSSTQRIRITSRIPREISLFLTILGCLAFIYYVDETLFDIISSTMSDAYLGVSIFVAVTLAIFYTLDRYFQSGLTKILNQNSFLQVPVASFLGALPGCGGAIIVVTQFVTGNMTFGALVAVLISTMGDAAFLLLAQKPDIALLVYSISLLAGITFGYAINWFHGHDYLKTPNNKTAKNSPNLPRIPTSLVHTFLILLLPGSILGVLGACQVDTNYFFGNWVIYDPVKWIGFIGALMCVAVWFSQPLDSWSARFTEKSEIKYLKETVVAETSFVSIWVIIGFLAYELLVYVTDLDLNTQFEQLGMFAILFAIIIGFIPGCGPQIVVTTLYINGVVPLSAQLANAISNDGDALFPAIAISPNAAIQATLYSAIPAFFIGYTAYFLGW